MRENSEEYSWDTQWTPAARTALMTAGVELLASISAQLEFFLTANLGTPWADKLRINEAVESAAIVYANAQLELTGNAFPFGIIISEHEDDNADDEDDEDEDSQLISRLSVLQRADYGVVDEGEVLTAGRTKFLENRPGESESNALSTISNLGAALYELAHADGWESLDRAPGLVPLGSIIQVLEPADEIQLTEGHPEVAEPDNNFSAGGSVLYTEVNRYR
ncbi:hypothetical protein RCH23_003299 [Cryobacterium sp. CAN_C3]|uniref:hypothetical protein n=1 Tax=unclassified Cryobacterium TaxID=2649013 RepID=UPI0018C914D9|nr:hypothetical protein [Cryobacterium sp. CAN_C3]MEC5155898.1 hypothetical protein [Cryobacterium sp. CAN_C3]